MHARPDRKVVPGEPSFTPTDHNHAAVSLNAISRQKDAHTLHVPWLLVHFCPRRLDLTCQDLLVGRGVVNENASS